MRILRTVGVGMGSVAASLALLAGIAFAEESSVKNDASRVKPAAVRAELKERAITVASTTKTQIKEIKQTAQDRVKAIREDAQERVKTLRESTERRVADLRDKKKQETAKKLAARLEELNKTWTDHFAKLVDRYDAMVVKMQKRAAAAAANGKDVSTANAAIQSARDAVAAAGAAVTVQAMKTYTLDTSTITTTTASTTPEGQDELLRALKLSFQTLHRALFSDLYAFRDGPMKTAREAVQNALQTLGKVPDVDTASAPTDSLSNSQ